MKAQVIWGMMKNSVLYYIVFFCYVFFFVCKKGLFFTTIYTLLELIQTKFQNPQLFIQFFFVSIQRERGHIMP